MVTYALRNGLSLFITLRNIFDKFGICLPLFWSILRRAHNP